MQKRMMRYGGALLFAGVLALAGCSNDGDTGPQGSAGVDGTDGTDGTNGTNGTNGTDGTDVTATAKAESCSVCHSGAGAAHQANYNRYTDASKLAITIDGIASVLNPGATTYTSTMTVTITKDGQPYTGDAALANLPQKTFYATTFDSESQKFDTTVNYNSPKATATPGQYTVTATEEQTSSVPSPLTFKPEDGPGVAFAYVAAGPMTFEAFTVYDDVAHDGLELGTVAYVSAANDSGCQKCHGTPYRKHGYRVASTPDLDDFAACKVCHYDTRNGGHQAWQLLVDDPLAYANQNGAPTDAQKAKYPYKASVMNDTHMSHAMEFAYPQSMANCVTCHEGKLDRILDNKFFTLKTCKSCHPMTGPEAKYVDAKRAPALKTLLTKANVASFHPADLYAADSVNCTLCHTGLPGARKFSEMHSGYDKQIYKDAMTKYSSVVTTTVDSAAFDKATNTLTVDFSVAGANAGAAIKPTVVVSLYGYGTKDFIVSGHGSQPDGSRNLEWADGGSRNSARLTVVPGTGSATWTAKADLSLWAGRLADGSVKKAEIAVLPALGADQAAAPSATNPQIAIAGATATVDLVASAIDEHMNGKAIVAVGNCNNCHDALATTFHSPNYGSAGVVGCRTCHTVLSGGSNLEMQSRSIDSYIHAIHSFQAFNPGDIDFADPVEALRYEHHIESTYPNFSIMNCESCHNSGTYGVPDQAKSLPGLLSAADANDTWDRTIGAVPMYVSGPAARACGSCHRAEAINEDDAGALASLNQHTGTFGTMLETTSATSNADLNAAIAEIFSIFK